MLILLFILLLPLSSMAQSSPPLPSGNITVIPTPLGQSYYSDKGGHVDVIGKTPGNQQYFAYDKQGQISSGYINQPFQDRPLLPHTPNRSPLDYLNNNR